MGFIPKISVSVEGNRCNCCDSDKTKPKPSELVVFYSEKKQKFMARRKSESPIDIDKKIIELTHKALEEFFKKTYPVPEGDIRRRAVIDMPPRLLSLDEVYEVEREASCLFDELFSPHLDNPSQQAFPRISRETLADDVQGIP